MTSGDVRATNRPTGTVTFLFTDIEGSTSRWEEQTVEMAAALALHDEAMRTAIEAHGGWLFKHTGDGVLAAFASPKEAVLAAIDAQRALELPVRMGIATGEAELRGDDYFGPTLNRAARVMAAGNGGQILLANSTAALVGGIDLLDLGERRLRDLSGAQRIFQVRADGLRVKFPPLRTLDAVPGNLRPQATSFIGRESEVAELVAAVLTNRLVTLTGVGGVGKTRLALQVAADLVPEFPEGVFAIELAPVGDPAAVPDAVASALGIIQQAGMSVAESIAEALAGRYRLLLLDNCEHVIDATAELVEVIFARSATVKVLATSREGLRIPAEHLWPVPSLAVSEGVDSAGVALFVERAQAVAPRFTLKRQEDAAAVVEICSRLDGIPLAIELAAARMVSMSPGEVRDRLGDRFRLLAGGRRALERHQTLRHAVQWSYDLLDAPERTLLNRCSVFAGGFDLQSAVVVCGGADLDEYAVLDLLDALVRKSLLSTERAGEKTRYGMLETIRQFAEDQLAATGSGNATRDVHARYFAGKEDEILALWNSPKQRDAHDWLETELANLRTAFRWAGDRGDLDTAAAIAVFGAFIGRYIERFEPVGWAEELLEPARISDHRRLRALYLMASLCCVTRRTEHGVQYAEAGRALGDGPHYVSPPFGYVHVWVGHAYAFAGSVEKFIDFSRIEGHPQTDLLVLARTNVVYGLALAGRTDEAIALADGMLLAAEEFKNPAELARSLWAFGLAFHASDPSRALRALRRGLAVARNSGARLMETGNAVWLAPLEAEYGDQHSALALFDQAIDSYHNSGQPIGLNQAFVKLSAHCLLLGRHEPAAIIFGASHASGRITLAALRDPSGHLCEILGAEAYERCVAEGGAMMPAHAVRFAHEQIQLAREDLARGS